MAYWVEKRQKGWKQEVVGRPAGKLWQIVKVLDDKGVDQSGRRGQTLDVF